MSISLPEANALDEAAFIGLAGAVFEHSPWVAARAWAARPFTSVDDLRKKMCQVVSESSPIEQMALIQAHPDLVGRVVLTAESKGEQAAAGLTELTPDEVASFDRSNRAYKEKFGFPFIICARLNKKDAILAAFPVRLENSREQEVSTALGEIYKIASLRLNDLITTP